METRTDEDYYTLEDNILKGFEIPIDLISLNIGEVLFDAFDRNPEHVAQIDTENNVKTTYAEMKDRSIRCALWLENQGLDSDDIICLCVHNHVDAYIPILASYFAQFIINPWRYDLTIDQARSWIELFKPKLIFTCTNALNVLEEALSLENRHAKIIIFDENSKYQSLNQIILSQSIMDVKKYCRSTHKTSQKCAIIMNTSGTTGTPKGVMISAETMLKNAYINKLYIQHKNMILYATPSSIVTNIVILSSIIHNATRIISNDTDPREMCRVIEKFKVNYVHMNAILFNSLARFDKIDEYNLDSLEAIRSGGMKVNRVTFRMLKSSCLRDKFLTGYGITEIGTARISQRLGRNYKSHHSIGFVSSNLQLKIVDRVTKTILGPNQLGEMLIKSSNMMLGYYKNLEATKNAIDDEGWYRTEDLGYYDETGEIFIMGRITNVVKYRDREFFTGEIEDILWEHPSVINVVVLSVPHNLDGEVPVAFVTIKSGENVTKEELVSLLRSSEKFKTINLKVHFMDTIPQSTSAKFVNKNLRQLALTLAN